MATRKVTVTLDEAQFEAVRGLVAAGKASSVSGFVQRAIEVTLVDAREWRAFLDSGLRETGGPMTARERRWADAVLSNRVKRGRHRRRGVA